MTSVRAFTVPRFGRGLSAAAGPPLAGTALATAQPPPATVEFLGSVNSRRRATIRTRGDPALATQIMKRRRGRELQRLCAGVTANASARSTIRGAIS